MRPDTLLLSDRLKDPDWRVRLKAVNDLLGTADPGAVEPLIAALRDKAGVRAGQHWVAVNRTAAAALGRLGSVAVQRLMDQLRDEDVDVKTLAAETLGTIRDHRAVPSLAAAVRDSCAGVRSSAAQALLQLGASGREALVSELVGGPEVARATAVKVVALASEPQFLPSLVDALHDESAAVRLNAVKGLGILADRRAGSALAPLLRDEEPPVRRMAAWSLGMIGDVRAEAPLRAAMTDSDETVAREAGQSLCLLRHEPR